MFNSSTFDLSAYNSATISLWVYHEQGEPSADDRLQVQVRSGTTWVEAGDPIPRYNGSTGWERHEIDISGFTGGTIQMGFVGISASGNDIHIDYIRLEAENIITDDDDDIVTDDDDDSSSGGSGGGGCNISPWAFPLFLFLLPLMALMGTGKK